MCCGLLCVDEALTYGCCWCVNVGATQQRTRMERTGPAMRSGYSGVKATVFGAYGFTGRYLINMLGTPSG